MDKTIAVVLRDKNMQGPTRTHLNVSESFDQNSKDSCTAMHVICFVCGYYCLHDYDQLIFHTCFVWFFFSFLLDKQQHVRYHHLSAFPHSCLTTEEEISLL